MAKKIISLIALLFTIIGLFFINVIGVEGRDLGELGITGGLYLNGQEIMSTEPGKYQEVRYPATLQLYLSWRISDEDIEEGSTYTLPNGIVMNDSMQSIMGGGGNELGQVYSEGNMISISYDKQALRKEYGSSDSYEISVNLEGTLSTSISSSGDLSRIEFTLPGVGTYYISLLADTTITITKKIEGNINIDMIDRDSIGFSIVGGEGAAEYMLSDFDYNKETRQFEKTLIYREGSYTITEFYSDFGEYKLTKIECGEGDVYRNLQRLVLI